MIMNAREIPVSILSLKALKIDKVWFRGFTEKELEGEINSFVKRTSYDRYILISDDVIVSQASLDNLLSLQAEAEIVTGWCNIFVGQTLAALELKPIDSSGVDFYLKTLRKIPRKGVLPVVRYVYHRTPMKAIMNWLLYKHFPTMDQIWDKPPLFRTYFVAWALTSVSRACWLKYGFEYPSIEKAGHGSDAKFSMDANRDGLIMLCARDSFVFHLASKRNFIVGKVRPEVIFEEAK